MRKILISLSIIGIVAVIAIGATVAYFGDVETSAGNIITAGTLDLKIDYQCDKPGCDFSLRDLRGQSFFSECDVKPGDSGEVTISWHVYNNNAWGRLRFADIYDYENGCTNSEIKAGDTTCNDPGEGEGELSQHLTFTAWMDQGSVPGWQCPEKSNGPCPADLQEGDNILNGVETPLVQNKPLSQIISEGGIKLPELAGSTTYYLGLQWNVLPGVGNIIQTDSLTGTIIMEVVQSRNNPTPWTP